MLIARSSSLSASNIGVSHAPRIIAGSFRGRRLIVPADGVRPTKDRVKAAIFSALDARGLLDDAVVLDACAGSGALGLEALSRGAAHATFYETDRGAVLALKRNVEAMVHGNATVRVGDVVIAMRTATGTFDLVFCDPPYDADPVWRDSALAVLCAVAPGGTIVLERGRRSDEPTVPAGWSVVWERTFGDTLVAFIQPANSSPNF